MTYNDSESAPRSLGRAWLPHTTSAAADLCRFTTFTVLPSHGATRYSLLPQPCSCSTLVLR